MVSFLDGDPDQPLVTGSVYNAESLPPYALPKMPPARPSRPHSSKGGVVATNELRFEDKKGSEQVFLHAQKTSTSELLEECPGLGRRRPSLQNRPGPAREGRRSSSSLLWTATAMKKPAVQVDERLAASMIIEGAMTGITAGTDVHIKGGANRGGGLSDLLQVRFSLQPAMPVPLPQAATAATAAALAAATGPTGVPLPPKEADTMASKPLSALSASTVANIGRNSMSWKHKVVWSEGMLLQPQHLQQHDRFLQTQLEARVRALRAYGWGFSALDIDPQQLALGKVSLLSYSGIFPDGTPVGLPFDDEMPPPLTIPDDARDLTVVLALPSLRPGSGG